MLMTTPTCVIVSLGAELTSSAASSSETSETSFLIASTSLWPAFISSPIAPVCYKLTRINHIQRKHTTIRCLFLIDYSLHMFCMLHSII